MHVHGPGSVGGVRKAWIARAVRSGALRFGQCPLTGSTTSVDFEIEDVRSQAGTVGAREQPGTAGVSARSMSASMVRSQRTMPR